MAEVPSRWKKDAATFRVFASTSFDRRHMEDLLRRETGHGPIYHQASSFMLECPEEPEWTFLDLSQNMCIDALYGFEAEAKCPVALYLDDTLMWEDCTGLSFEDALPVSLMAAESLLSSKHARGLGSTMRIRIVPSVASKVTCKAAVLTENSREMMISNLEHTVEKGYVLKRLQNPETDVGNYFSFHDADLDKCGVSRFYTDKHGVEQEKEVRWFRVKHTFKCLTHRALDATDTWSSTIPYKCKGGEVIMRLFTTTYEKWDDYFNPITEDEAKDVYVLEDHKAWCVDDLEAGITFVEETARVPYDHPIMAVFNKARPTEDVLTSEEFSGGSARSPFYMADAEGTRGALEIVRRMVQEAEATHVALSGDDKNLVFKKE